MPEILVEIQDPKSLFLCHPDILFFNGNFRLCPHFTSVNYEFKDYFKIRYFDLLVALLLACSLNLNC